MCVVSNIGDSWQRDFDRRWPSWPTTAPFTLPQVSREEFESLKKELQELKELLLAAKKYDAATGQPDCEMDEKVRLITEIAKLVGVDIGDVFNQVAPK